MTKEVMITIEGIQLGTEEEPIVTTAVGTYHLMNGKHYIHYEEMVEGLDDTSKNTIKISRDRIVLMKKGIQTAQMIFDLQEEDRAVYQTPYGSLSFKTNTKSINVNETPSKLEVQMDYSLYSDAAKLSDNRLNIAIEARQ